MAIGFPRKGMFGGVMQRNPWDTPGIGDGVIEQQFGEAMPIGVDQINRPKKSFFGQGGPGRAIAGTIGDFLLQQSGMDPIYMPNVLQQRDAEERARMAQQQRMQGREEFLFRENYKRQNPEPQQPDQLTQYMINAGIDPKSPEAQGMYRRAVQNKVDPIQGVPYMDEQGNSGIQFIRPGQAQGGPAAAPTSKEAYDALPPGAQYHAPDGSIRTKGGQAASPPATFRR